MTLIVALQTSDNRIVIAADGMNFTYGDGLGGSTEQYSYRNNKLIPVKGTNWTLAFAGVAALKVLHKRLETEIDVGVRPPFHSHINIGGPDYLDALICLSQDVYHRGEEMPFCPTVLAGFDSDGKAQILVASLPRPGYFFAPGSFSLGAQETTSNWIMQTLGGACTTLENVKRLAYFTIWQISKQDVRVGKIESGYPIDLCVMSANSPTQFEEMNTVPGWMHSWETRLQESFSKAISSP